MKKVVINLCVMVLGIMGSPALASTADMPDINEYNWQMNDDFSDIGYTLNNWDLSLPSGISFGINADDEFGYLQAGYSSYSYSGTISPHLEEDVLGIRADLRVSSLAMNSNPASYYMLGVEILPQISLNWGMMVLDNKLEGTLMLRQYGSTSIIRNMADFDVVVGETYNLAITYNDITNEYYLYLNGEKKTNIYFPGIDSDFSAPNIRMFTRNVNSQFEFDNVEYATVPEPVSLLLLGLGGLFIRKRILR